MNNIFPLNIVIFCIFFIIFFFGRGVDPTNSYSVFEAGEEKHSISCVWGRFISWMRSTGAWYRIFVFTVIFSLLSLFHVLINNG